MKSEIIPHGSQKTSFVNGFGNFNKNNQGVLNARLHVEQLEKCNPHLSQYFKNMAVVDENSCCPDNQCGVEIFTYHIKSDICQLYDGNVEQKESGSTDDEKQGVELYYTTPEGQKVKVAISEDKNVNRKHKSGLLKQILSPRKKLIRAYRGFHNDHFPGLYSFGVLKNIFLMKLGRVESVNLFQVTITDKTGEVKNFLLGIGIQPAKEYYSIEQMKNDGVTVVVTAQEPHENGVPGVYHTYTREDYESAGIKQLVLPTRDYKALTRDFIGNGLDAMRKAMENNDGRCFIHCKSGVGRSATLLVAFVSEEEVKSGEDPLTAFNKAFLVLKANRKKANVNAENARTIMELLIHKKAMTIVKEQNQKGLDTTVSAEVEKMKWMIEAAVTFRDQNG